MNYSLHSIHEFSKRIVHLGHKLYYLCFCPFQLNFDIITFKSLLPCYQCCTPNDKQKMLSIRFRCNLAATELNCFKGIFPTE